MLTWNDEKSWREDNARAEKAFDDTQIKAILLAKRTSIDERVFDETAK